MKKRYDLPAEEAELRDKIVGLGAKSVRKSYYPVLREKLEDLERYKTLLDQSNDAIFLIKVPSGQFLDVSKSACRQLGCSEEDCISLTIYNLLPGNRKELNDILSGRAESLVLDTLLLKCDQKETPYEVDMRNVRFGNEDFVVAVARDISMRKLAEGELRESEEKFRALAESSPAAIIVYQGDWLVSVNPAAEQITGYSKAELLQMRTIDLIHPDYREMIQDRARRRQRGEPEPSQYETKIITKRGEVRWVILSVGLMMYRGKPAGVVTLLDITERKQAEAALRESEWRFRQLADCSPMPIALYDNDEKVTYLNTKFISTFGYTLDDIPTLSSWWPLAYPDPVYRQELVEKWAVYIDKVIRGLKGVAPMEAMVTCNDRSVRCIEFYLSVIGNQKMVILQDITERKQAENDLLEAKAQAELYLDLMSHDITNMNQAMMGYLELMEAAWESGTIDKGLMDSLIVTLNRSSRLISDVKKLTHLLARKVPLKDVDLCEILAAVKARHSMVPGRIVTINYAPLQDCMVRACDTIGDLFDNLVDNAIRHSTGPVAIDIAVDRILFEGRRYYRISVADTGPGIPDDLKKKIFLTIQEIEARPERTGFGLYLVRTLIDYHHGKIWVEDRVPGDSTKGANFVVMIPAAEK